MAVVNTPGQLIARARLRAGLTQSELAARLGTTQSAISRLELDVNSPRMVTIKDTVEACGLRLWLGLQEHRDPRSG